MRFKLIRSGAFALIRAMAIFLLVLSLIGLSIGAPDGIAARSLAARPTVSAVAIADTMSGSAQSAQQLQTATAIDVGTTALLSKENAALRVNNDVVGPFLNMSDQSKGLRVLQYKETIAKGAVVESAFAAPEKRASSKLVAQNPSWLFMVDEQPGAHFAHPVKLVLVDAATGQSQEMETDWWPKVNSIQLFDTEALRTDVAATTFYKKPVVEEKLSIDYKLLGDLGKIKPVTSCDVWAVLVCGYNDISDTFDDDTNGMYSVLKNLGVSDDHIFYVSPHSSHAGVDRPTSRGNVLWAINEVASRSDAKDKVLFLYSSHGNVNFVSCVPGSPDGGSITSDEMDSWLDAINCKEMTIIIEACHSGSFIGKYKDGTYTASENELTGDGETNRIVFTSASSDTSSYGDVDGASDPNPTDSGSESIYGYIMAFSIASADTDGNGRISFGEAYKYAWDNDVTRILGWNTPQMIEAGLKKANVYHQCLQYECYTNLASPVLTLTGTEDYTASGGQFTRYKLSVTNWNVYPSELFQVASDLPPCGLNANSARTWVDIYNEKGARLYGFCALGSPSDLQSLWFAVKKGDTPPNAVYIVMTDRRCNQVYKSNKVTITSGSAVMVPVQEKALVQQLQPLRVVEGLKYTAPS